MLQNYAERETEVPEIVLRKVEEALAQIRTEGAETVERKRFIGRRASVAAACICLLAVSCITVTAGSYFWNRGMRGTLQATNKQQQHLLTSGVTTVFGEEADNMAVTSEGVTIKPTGIISDGRFAYVFFDVEGFALEEELEPSMGHMKAYFTDDPEGADGYTNINGSFYNGFIRNETGDLLYDDGTKVQRSEDGSRLLLRSRKEQGVFEYVVVVPPTKLHENFIGKTVHICMENLSTMNKEQIELRVPGKWEFDITLTGQSATTDIPVREKIGNTGYMLQSVSISPVSIQAEFSMADGSGMDPEEEIPFFRGVVLKDGSRCMCYGSGMGLIDGQKGTMSWALGLDKVLDVKQIQAVILQDQKIQDRVKYYEVEIPQ